MYVSYLRTVILGYAATKKKTAQAYKHVKVEASLWPMSRPCPAAQGPHEGGWRVRFRDKGGMKRNLQVEAWIFEYYTDIKPF